MSKVKCDMNPIVIMRHFLFGLALVAGLLATGCETRSISDSGYHRSAKGWSYRGPYHTGEYRGELNEFDVIGVDRGETVSEADIHKAIHEFHAVKLKPNSTLLTIQSGAEMPDTAMVSELNKHFKVVPFAGVPPNNLTNAGNYARSLRLAAAQIGASAILCYWGVLESANDKLPTKAISWVPVINFLVPDEVEKMRIRLKLALVEVDTGNWSIFTPEPFEDKTLSTDFHREHFDQKLVELLKQKAYESAAKDLERIYLAP